MQALSGWTWVERARWAPGAMGPPWQKQSGALKRLLAGGQVAEVLRVFDDQDDEDAPLGIARFCTTPPWAETVLLTVLLKAINAR